MNELVSQVQGSSTARNFIETYGKVSCTRRIVCGKTDAYSIRGKSSMTDPHAVRIVSRNLRKWTATKPILLRITYIPSLGSDGGNSMYALPASQQGFFALTSHRSLNALTFASRASVACSLVSRSAVASKGSGNAGKDPARRGSMCSNPMASSTSGAICAEESRTRGIPA
jgi:hypothetical protein